jgi:hypothetical protein
MTLDEVLVIMNNRVITLGEARKAAVASGDLEKVIQIDGDLVTTFTTIDRLKNTINFVNNPDNHNDLIG